MAVFILDLFKKYYIINMYFKIAFIFIFSIYVFSLSVLLV